MKTDVAGLPRGWKKIMRDSSENDAFYYSAATAASPAGKKISQ